MADFIFLHGSFHAAWNWHHVLPLLAHAGHRGIAMDLPGHGRDRTAARRVTLEACVDAVQRTLDSLPGKAVLVAHSRNGIVISQAAERCPEKIAGRIKEYQDRFANPFIAAERGYIDEVIMPRNTRRRLCRSLNMLRNKTVENPWKKHDNIPL